MKYQIICEECDSEYIIFSEDDLYQDDPSFCAICSEPISPDIIEEDEEQNLLLNPNEE